MKRFACYLAAVALHALILFGVKLTAPPPPPVVEEKKYIEVTLAAPPSPEPPAPAPKMPPPPSPPPPPKVEPTPPEPTPEPPPPPKEEAPPPPEPKPESPPPTPVSQVVPPMLPIPQPPPAATPIAPAPNPVPVPPAPGQYLSVTQPSYLIRVEPDYPIQARRQHEQGSVTLALYINALGSLDKVEIVQSSGHPLLDNAAVDAIKQSRFKPAYQDNTPVSSRAEVTITFRLQ